MNLFHFLKKQTTFFGVDLGTTSTLICSTDGKILLNEKTVVAMASNEQGASFEYIYGNEANELIGKTPFRIEIVSPVEDGTVSKGLLTEYMIRAFLEKINHKKNILQSFDVVVGVPFNATDIEKEAIRNIFEKNNAQNIFLVYESIGSAIGAKAEILKPNGYLIIDIGGGTTEISIISLGGIINNRTFKYGGKKIDEMILSYIQKKYNVVVGLKTVEDVKKAIGYAFITKQDKEQQYSLQGRNVNTNLPEKIIISSKDISIATAEFVNTLLDNLNKVLQMAPPELLSDIMSDGIILCGGGANLRNLDYVIEKSTGLKVFIPNDPELCLIRGIQQIITNIKQYKNVIFTQEY